MNLETYNKVSGKLIKLAESIESSKRPGYTQDREDVLWNFKSVAERLGVTPLQAWGVYFLKHIDAISSLAKDPAIPQAESIEGRFADAVNYLKLGIALVKENPENEKIL